MWQSQKIKKYIIQFIKFGIVGFSNTLICYLVYVILIKLNFHYLLSNAVGFLISVLNAFYWNNKYVFKQNEEYGIERVWWKALLKSILSYSLSSLFLASILLYLWIDVWNISPYLGQLLNLFITIPLNFMLNKLWAFK